MERTNAIAVLERLLGVELPRAYQDFLSERDSLVVDGYGVAGLPAEGVPVSILELASISGLKRDDLPSSLVAICINAAITRALCLDLASGNEQDAPLVEMDLTGNDFVEPRPLGKTFRQWIEEHEGVARRFRVARNRLEERRRERDLQHGRNQIRWNRIISRVRDYVIGLAAFRFNQNAGCLEVDEFFSVDQPLIKKGEAVRVLLNEIFSRARDYGGCLKLMFTRDEREDLTGCIPESMRRRTGRRLPVVIPREITDTAEKHGIALREASSGIITHDDAASLWLGLLDLPSEVKEKITELEHAGFLSRELMVEVVATGEWSREELIWIFTNAPRPEALLLGSDLPEDRLYYSQSLQWGRACLLASRFREAIRADLTEGKSIEDIEESNKRCTLEPHGTFWILEANEDFKMPSTWLVAEEPEPPSVLAGEPLLMATRPTWPVSTTSDVEWIRKEVELLATHPLEVQVRVLLLDYEFRETIEDSNGMRQLLVEAKAQDVNILFAPNRMDLFLDRELESRMRRARKLQHFMPRKGPLALHVIEIPDVQSSEGEVPNNLKAIHRAMEGVLVFAEGIAQRRDLEHSRREFTLHCDLVQRMAIQEYGTFMKLGGDEGRELAESLVRKDGPLHGMTIPFVGSNEMPELVQRINSPTLAARLREVKEGMVVTGIAWDRSPVPIYQDEGESQAVEMTTGLLETLDARSQQRRYARPLGEIRRGDQALRTALETGTPLSVLSAGPHATIEVLRNYIYAITRTREALLRIVFGDGTEGEPFPLFSQGLPPMGRPDESFVDMSMSLISSRHMEVELFTERALIRNLEIQYKGDAGDQECLACGSVKECLGEILQLLRGELPQKERSTVLKAFLLQKPELESKRWDGLRLQLFHSTNFEPAVIGAYRGIVDIMKEYRGQLVIVPRILRGGRKPAETDDQSAISDGDYAVSEEWY